MNDVSQHVCWMGFGTTVLGVVQASHGRDSSPRAGAFLRGRGSHRGLRPYLLGREGRCETSGRVVTTTSRYWDWKRCVYETMMNTRWIRGEYIRCKYIRKIFLHCIENQWYESIQSNQICLPIYICCILFLLICMCSRSHPLTSRHGHDLVTVGHYQPAALAAAPASSHPSISCGRCVHRAFAQWPQRLRQC